MRKFLENVLGKAYVKIKASPYFTSLYYSVANSSYFSNFFEHEKMLIDRARMDTYHKAITDEVKEGDTVIDLGTGTGILSFFAASKSPKKIYAIDHGKIIESAKIVSKHNNIKNIEFVNVNSKNFDLNSNEKADIIIHEQIGALLFDEHMVVNILDLRDRVLKKGGKILPGKFEVYIEPVKLKNEFRVPYIWEMDVYGIKYDCFNSTKENLDGNYKCIFIKPNEVDYFLCEPERVLYFDMETMKADSLPKQIKYTKKVTRAGNMDGFCFYFNAIFDNGTVLTTDPLISTTHCWNVPILRTVAKHYKAGDTVTLDLEWEDPSDINTYKWNIETA
ncbi:MAG: methyltransferase domain-containing protein [Bacteroidota bacterium]|nr:methyltransferase domain-containing protein [Bacteroidota bacterium]